jgi:hypothetical protein
MVSLEFAEFDAPCFIGRFSCREEWPKRKKAP